MSNNCKIHSNLMCSMSHPNSTYQSRSIAGLRQTVVQQDSGRVTKRTAVITKLYIPTMYVTFSRSFAPARGWRIRN